MYTCIRALPLAIGRSFDRGSSGLGELSTDWIALIIVRRSSRTSVPQDATTSVSRLPLEETLVC